MALWLDSNSEPQTENEKADLAAIAALKVSTALELKDEGNEYVRKGKKHYKDAIDCYTRAINQKGLGESETSILFANRAHVNLLLGNNRRAFEDAEQAVKLSPTNVKAIYRAAKASFALDMLKEAITYCEQGLELSSDNEDLKKLVKLASGKLAEREKHEAEVSKALRGAKDLLSAFEDRGLKIGKAMFRELTGLKKPDLDKSKILHWPVVLLYPEVMSSDIIEDFCETDMFSSHLDIMFSEDCPPLPWDKENVYTRENIELYYEVGSSVCLSKTRILHYLLEGTPGAGAVSIDEEKDSSNYGSPTGKGPSRWVKVNKKRTLHDILKEPNLVIPGIPVFYIVSKSSAFYNKFKSGKWALPQVPGEDTA
ncbi:tetratricopeptide repeat protein 4 homolog [Chenopodium quinoa]|uniref:tetratricopeptide repeat protein 4 homolog n=1 Tax=Chenopodium quinoa TaxID=63459 RepID=UPI000B78BDAC|nr:tetratricopeptide repeat protein 4 homolog [Chenopodium quinoa]